MHGVRKKRLGRVETARRKAEIKATLRAIGKAEPDRDAIALLQDALARAKAGDLRAVVIIGELNGDSYSAFSNGDGYRMIGLLEHVKVRILDALPNPEPVDPKT